MIEGGTLDLDIVVGARALSLARTRMQREGNECYTGWKKTRGTLCGRLRPWMQRTGWQEDAYTAWKWHHAGIGATLDLANQEKREVAHLARKAWRESHWRRFLRGRRKDAAIASQHDAHYPTAAVKVARQWMTKHPALFSLASGSFKSPQHWDVAQPGKFVNTCPHCGVDTGADLEHIMCTCPARAVKLCKPAHPLQQRLGWPMDRDMEFNKHVWKWMSRVVVQVWTQIFPNSPPGLEA